MPSTSASKAWIVTGPTSGIGYHTALELAKHGTVVLVGRNPDKLRDVQNTINSKGGRSVAVVADLSDVTSARRAAADIVALDLPIAGLLNNAGIMPLKSFKTAQGWDGSYATNHLGPFALTDALIPHLRSGANVVFVCSAVEDPERKISVRAGYRGSRFISVEASARGEWRPGGSTNPGADAYATSKQGNLVAVFALAREYPQLHFRAVEPGVTPGSNLARDMNPALRMVGKAMSPIASLIPNFSTPKHAARVITNALTDTSDATGVYYDENGKPMIASTQVQSPEFCHQYVVETRKLLATVLTTGK
jgi:NAD(P)-dependent dehydrogenase (short-subunit alcohol dehydrogenase family)